jgi:competence protein ComEC
MRLLLSFIAGIICYYAFHYFPVTTVLGILSFSFLFMRGRRLLVLSMVLAVAYVSLRDCSDHEIPSVRQPTDIRCAFETYPERTGSGLSRQTARVESARTQTTGESIQALTDREIVVLSDREFTVGREYQLVVTFLKNRNRLNPGSYLNSMPYARLLEVRDEGITTPSLTGAVRERRHRIHAFISEHFPKDSGALISSVSVGPLSDISSPLREAFNITGLAHVLSISGTHFGLFSLLLFGIFRMIIQVLPQPILHKVTLYLTPSQASAVCSFPFMIVYLGLSGGSIPAVRSFIMIGLFLLGLIIGRKGFWLNSLIFAAFIILLWNPHAIFSLSFQLSFLAVAFIGLAVGHEDAGEKGEPKIIRYVRTSVLLSLAAVAGTAPLVAYSFHYISLISPVSNLIIAPLIGFVLIPLSVISAFIFLVTGYYPFVSIIGSVAEMSLSLVRKFSEIPYAGLKIPGFPPGILLLFYSGLIIYFLCHKKKLLLLVPVIPILLYGVFSIVQSGRLAVTFLDVGQGDAAVAELPDGKTLVIDTGATGREVTSFLQYRGRKSVDAVVLSHLHPDHTGGLRFIDQRFDVHEFWHSSRLSLPDGLRTSEHRTLERGDLMEGEGYRISVLHPYPEFYTVQENEYVAANNDSLVLRIEDRNGSFLFTGDVESEAEEDMHVLDKWLASDVMKVPHHGGRTSSYQPFIHAVNADIAVISAERDNPFGHPHQEMLGVLAGKKVLRTDTEGAVRIEKTEHGYDIKTYAEFQFENAEGIDGEMRNYRRLFRRW